MPQPVLQALVLADHIYVDPDTQKKTIIGTFNTIWSNQFPNQLNKSTFAYVSLTEVQGKIPLQLRYVDLQDNKLLIKLDFEVESSDPLTSIELIFAVPPFPMPQEGVFAFEVVYDDVSIGSLRVLAKKKA